MQITIETGTGNPSRAEWERLFRYLDDQLLLDGAVLESLLCRYILEEWRGEEQHSRSLRKEPIWRTIDETGFPLWLYADGSDSEG